MPKKLTLNKLARTAGVSAATVSRIIAGNRSVDPAIRTRVLKTAQKLGMDLDDWRRGKPRIIAFLLSNRDALQSFQARVLLGAQGYCALHKWEMLFTSFRYSPDTPPKALHFPQLLSGQTNAQAVILGGSNSPNLLAAFNDRGIPFVVLGHSVTGDWKPETYDVAYTDDVSGAKEATLHLIAQGHQTVGFIGNTQFPWFKRCSIGYSHAMTDAGLKPNIVDIRSEGFQLGYLALKSLLSKSPRPSAIMVGTDQVAAGVYFAIREANLSVPADISVFGFNDTQGEFMSPPLSSVREFPEELGRHMAEFVINRLRDPSIPPQHITIPCQLIHRNSVAAPQNANVTA